MKAEVTVVAFSRSGLSFETESEGRVSPLGRERERDEDGERKAIEFVVEVSAN